MDYDILDLPFVIPEGIYKFQYVTHWTRRLHNTGKVEIRLKITEGDNTGKELSCFFNAKRIIGKPRQCGYATAGAKSRLFRELCSLIEIEPEESIDFDQLEFKEIIGKVETTKKDSKGTPLHEKAQYSTITRIGYFTEEELEEAGIVIH